MRPGEEKDWGDEIYNLKVVCLQTAKTLVLTIFVVPLMGEGIGGMGAKNDGQIWYIGTE
jgi:hypothetical protein